MFRPITTDGYLGFTSGRYYYETKVYLSLLTRIISKLGSRFLRRW